MYLISSHIIFLSFMIIQLTIIINYFNCYYKIYIEYTKRKNFEYAFYLFIYFIYYVKYKLKKDVVI